MDKLHIVDVDMPSGDWTRLEVRARSAEEAVRRVAAEYPHATDIRWVSLKGES